MILKSDAFNIFTGEPPKEGEVFETLFLKDDIKIVKIISGKIEEPMEFCQEEDEWVVLCKGRALLAVDGRRVELKEGDYIYIPAKTPHTLLEVEEGSLWLAFHFKSSQ